jgi:hypothetical protein
VAFWHSDALRSDLALWVSIYIKQLHGQLWQGARVPIAWAERQNRMSFEDCRPSSPPCLPVSCWPTIAAVSPMLIYPLHPFASILFQHNEVSMHQGVN